jgi:hypothetical protein
MLLTAEEHPEAIKRYAHVARAGGWGGSECGSRLDGTARSCTRQRGHSGPHVSHGGWRKILAVWDESSNRRASRPASRKLAEAVARKRPARKPLGLPERPRALLQILRDWVARAVDSAEEITFIVFFLAFVGFSLYWLWLILG